MPDGSVRRFVKRLKEDLEISLRLKTYFSQKGQDRWVVEEVFKGKKGGYFVDVGASDGIKGSNTFALERRFGWQGICTEANAVTFRKLAANRRCHCSNSCIDGDRRSVQFIETGTVGGIVDHDVDNDPRKRPQVATSERLTTKQTITLEDLLRRYDAPPIIDFLSLDVEGAETRILSAFPFHRYTFLSMCIERPTPELNQLLFQNGYVFIRKSRILNPFDSFYVHTSLPQFGSLEREPFSETPRKAQ